MKRKYIKPSIINYFLLADSALLAGSGNPPATGDMGQSGTDIRKDEGITTGNGGEALSKQYNAWEAWDEF